MRFAEQARAVGTQVLTPEQQAQREAERAEREAREREEQRSWRRQCLLDQIYSDVGPRYSADRCTLDNFKFYDSNQKPVVAQMRSLDLRDMVAKANSLILYGPCGTGKDHLVISRLYAGAQQLISSRWLNVLEWFGSLRDMIDGRGTEDGVLRDLAKPDILVLSDPVPPRRERALSPWNIEMLYRLVDRRYRALKGTWLTVNVATIEEIDEALSAPVFDRLQERAEFVPCFWESWRELLRRGDPITRSSN